MKTVREVIAAMRHELERSERPRTTGMGANMHNSADFASAHPHVRARIAWWAKRLEEACDFETGGEHG